MKSTFIIYALYAPGTTNVRYIGKTTQKLGRTIEQSILHRIRQHCSNCNGTRRSHVKSWIKSLCDRGERPDFSLIDLGTDETWKDLEKFHIASHRNAGFDLTNIGDGGEDSHYTDATRLLASGKLKGRPKSLQTRARIAASRKGQPSALKGRTLPEAQRLKHVGRTHLPETRARISAAKTGQPGHTPWNKGLHTRPEHLWALNAARKGQPLPQETRDKIAATERRTHCKRGHEFTPENIYIIPSTGARQCKVCIRQRYAQQAAQRKAMGPTPRPARTHCVNGHDYTPANRYVAPDGKSACRICQRERTREYRRQRKPDS